MIVDLGCGDGRGALALAATAAPGLLVLAVDAAAPPMAEASRRAAKSSPNLLFLVASAEAFAAELPGVADRLVVTLPWGSLLRGVLGLDAGVAAAVAAIPRLGGSVSVLASVTPRDGVAGLAMLEHAAVAGLVPPPGLELVEACPATRDEILATGSKWGRRLFAGGSGGSRPVWRLEWRRVR